MNISKDHLYYFLNNRFSQEEILYLTNNFKGWRTFNRIYIQFDDIGRNRVYYGLMEFFMGLDGKMIVLNKTRGHKNKKKTIIGYRMFFEKVDIINILNYQKEVLLIIFRKFMGKQVGRGFLRNFLNMVYAYF